MNPPNDGVNGFPVNGGSYQFERTHWTEILTAKQGSSAEAAAALERLCEIYWWPLYGFVRRHGRSPHDAEDLTQEFFARFLAGDFLESVDQSKGKFRSYLLAAMENLMTKEWHKENTKKRGREYTFVSADAEERFQQIPSSTQTPEQVYDQQWAIALLNRVVDRLKEEYYADGEQAFFEATKICLTGEKPPELYADLAAQLGTSEGALKMRMKRMKNRYLKLLRAEVACTVSNREQIEDELRAIIAALS